MRKAFPVRPKRFGAVASLITVLLSGNVFASTVVEPGLSAAWYDPERSGEGWVLEILDEDRATVYWFTYDDNGGQRWMIGVGQVTEDGDGPYIQVPELIVTRGARFGDVFDPAGVVYEVVGSAVFRFDDCQTGTVSFSAFGESGESTLRRLSRTMGAGCSPLNGIPGELVREYAGQSGNWYDPAHTGEGFVIQWLTRDEALAYWFTYDGEGKQAWIFGLGEYVDGAIEFADLHATRGARFGADFDPADVEIFDWGTMSLELACTTGAMSYESGLPAFGEGGQDLVRLSSLASPACPYVQPRLTDLYDAEWTEVPVPDDGSITVRRVLDDGTVIGMRELAGEAEGEIVILAPGSENWLTLDGQVVLSDSPILVSPDTARIVATEAPGEDFSAPFEPVAWWADTGWAPVAGIDSPYSLLTGGSRDGNVLLGRSYLEGDPEAEQPWISDPVGAQRALPVKAGHESGYTPTAATDDGTVAIGYRSIPITATPVPPIAEQTGRQALRWVNEGSPHFLKDPEGTILGTALGCSDGCAVIFGQDFSELEIGDERLDKPKAWFWTPDGRFGLLEPLIEHDYVHVPEAINTAGTMIVGTATSYVPIVTPAPPQVQAIAWTQRTGTFLLANLITLQTADDDDWNGFDFKSSAVDITSAGERILVRLYREHAEEGPSVRAGILTLTPKE